MQGCQGALNGPSVNGLEVEIDRWSKETSEQLGGLVIIHDLVYDFSDGIINTLVIMMSYEIEVSTFEVPNMQVSPGIPPRKERRAELPSHSLNGNVSGHPSFLRFELVHDADFNTRVGSARMGLGYSQRAWLTCSCGSLIIRPLTISKQLTCYHWVA